MIIVCSAKMYLIVDIIVEEVKLETERCLESQIEFEKQNKGDSVVQLERQE